MNAEELKFEAKQEEGMKNMWLANAKRFNVDRSPSEPRKLPRIKLN